MADSSRGTARTPARAVGGPKKPTMGSTGKQQSILGFFSKGSSAGANASTSSSPIVKPPPSGKENQPSPSQTQPAKSAPLPKAKRQASNITPAPSSDPAGPPSSQDIDTNSA